MMIGATGHFNFPPSTNSTCFWTALSAVISLHCAGILIRGQIDHTSRNYSPFGSYLTKLNFDAVLTRVVV